MRYPPQVDAKVFLMVSIDLDGEVGVLQVHFHHPISSTHQALEGLNAFHFEMRGCYKRVQPF